jgi:hypothetical protein
MRGMSLQPVAVTRTIVLRVPPGEAFDFLSGADVLPKILKGHGLLPAVTGTSEQTGPWDMPGSKRMIHLSDRTTVREEVLRAERGVYFGYHVWDYTNPLFKRLVDHARGSFEFRQEGAGTSVAWTYAFTPRGAMTRPLLWLIVHLLYQGYMESCLRETMRILSEPRP